MKKTKKLVILILIICALCCAAGCGNEPTVRKGKKADAQENIIGSVEDIMRTYWFDYTVNTAENVGAGQTEGSVVIKLNVTFTNTSEREVNIYAREFICYYSTEEGVYTLPCAYESESRMPEAFALAAAQSATYDIYYEIPADSQRVEIGFVEYFADGSYGDKFYVDIDLVTKK